MMEIGGSGSIAEPKILVEAPAIIIGSGALEVSEPLLGQLEPSALYWV